MAICKTNHKVHKRNVFSNAVICQIQTLLLYYTASCSLQFMTYVPKYTLVIYCQELSDNHRDWLDGQCLINAYILVPHISPEIQCNVISPQLIYFCKNTG